MDVLPVVNIHGFMNGGKTFPIGLSQLVEALELIAAYLDEIDPYLPKEEEVPLEGVIQKQWQGWIYQKDKNGQRRIRRVRYELCVLQSLRCREIWVAGANRYRNPDEDVPGDFDEKRDTYYEALQPCASPSARLLTRHWPSASRISGATAQPGALLIPNSSLAGIKTC